MCMNVSLLQIVGKGPTLLIVEDQSGNKFGGFASVSWEVKPQFQGDGMSYVVFGCTEECIVCIDTCLHGGTTVHECPSLLTNHKSPSF